MLIAPNADPDGSTEGQCDRRVEVLRAGEHLSISAGEWLAERLEALAAAGCPDLVVDLGRARTVEPVAVLLLVRTARRLRPLGARVSLVADPLLLVFDVPGLEEFDRVATSLDDVA
jgi:hypothetical protein